MKRFTTLAAVAAAFAVAAPAASANPAKDCAELGNLGLSRGACASTLASGGSPDNPSTAAFVANCKSLEANGVPEIGAPPIQYPYAFYGRENDPRYVAKNRAGCVRVLRALHTGQIPPGPQPRS